MDAETLDFADSTFDIVLCAFGIFFLPDMVRGVREMYRVLKPGGCVALSAWPNQSFQPMENLTRVHFERYDVVRVDPPEPWMECKRPEHLLTLLERGNFRERDVTLEPAGYFINPDEWWTLMEGSGWRRGLTLLPPGDLERFKEDILEEARRLGNEHGVWLDASALIGIGKRV